MHIYGPDWFHGIDTTIEILSIAVAFMVSLYAYKIYKLTKQKKYAYFSAAFMLASIAYIFKVISEVVIYSHYVEQHILGPFVISKTVIQPVTWIHNYAHSLFSLLLLFSTFILLMVTLEVKNKHLLVLLTYFMVIITLISDSAPFIFHLTNVLMLSMLVLHYYNNHARIQTKQSLYVTLAFLSMLISHIILIFKEYDPDIYATGLLFQLIGFGTLLYAFILVKRK